MKLLIILLIIGVVVVLLPWAHEPCNNGHTTTFYMNLESCAESENCVMTPYEARKYKDWLQCNRQEMSDESP